MREEIVQEKEIIAHAGELPEVAFYSSLYFLTQEPEGPQLVLTPAEISFLKKGVIEGYKRIILRDLNPKIKGKTEFRSIERAIINFKRLKRYAYKEKFDISEIIPQIAKALAVYMKAELEDVYLEKHSLRTVNCEKEDWEWFIKELHLENSSLLPNTEAFFKRTPLSFKETIELFKIRKNSKSVIILKENP
ncbi:hypothetical protein BLFGPEAP_02143 [Candidatus Methanoperedenaceae archaeon GB50]|nr:hypothetical protein BLFGPEAP_02143 [Candidatus Methanoperedenaceae archaeon GB50]